MGQGATRDAIRNAPKEEYYNGYGGKAYYAASQRKNGSATGKVAAFIAPQDEIPVQLIYSLQRRQPLQKYKDFRLTRILYSDESMVWVNETGDTAIICLVGLNIAQNNQHLLDDLHLAGFTQGEPCELRLKTIADKAIAEIKSYGIPTIICIGYSLGGTTAACVSDQVTRSIILDGGAPPTNPPRITPPNCTCYHIVGDILSTHWTVATRVYLDEVKDSPNLKLTHQYYQIDAVRWVDVAYYHDMDRFMDYGSPYKLVDARFEQTSLVNYLTYNKDELSLTSGIAGAISESLNFLSTLKGIVCKNPVPGAGPGEACNETDTAGYWAGAALGGAVGGLTTVLGGPPLLAVGTATGAGIGARVLSGQTGLFEELAPDLALRVSRAGALASGYATDIVKEQQANNVGAGKFTGKINPGVVDVLDERNAYTDGMVLRGKNIPI